MTPIDQVNRELLAVFGTACSRKLEKFVVPFPHTVVEQSSQAGTVVAYNPDNCTFLEIDVAVQE